MNLLSVLALNGNSTICLLVAFSLLTQFYFLILVVSEKKQDWCHKRIMSTQNINKFSHSKLSPSTVKHIPILLRHVSTHSWKDSPGILRGIVFHVRKMSHFDDHRRVGVTSLSHPTWPCVILSQAQGGHQGEPFSVVWCGGEGRESALDWRGIILKRKTFGWICHTFFETWVIFFFWPTSYYFSEKLTVISWLSPSSDFLVGFLWIVLVLGQLRPGQLRPGQLRPGQLRPGKLRTGQLRLWTFPSLDKYVPG